MLTKKLKDFFKISSRYKSQKNFKFPKRKYFKEIQYPFSTQAFSTMQADQGKRTKETTGESIPESKQIPLKPPQIQNTFQKGLRSMMSSSKFKRRL